MNRVVSYSLSPKIETYGKKQRCHILPLDTWVPAVPHVRPLDTQVPALSPHTATRHPGSDSIPQQTPTLPSASLSSFAKQLRRATISFVVLVSPAVSPVSPHEICDWSTERVLNAVRAKNLKTDDDVTLTNRNKWTKKGGGVNVSPAHVSVLKSLVGF